MDHLRSKDVSTKTVGCTRRSFLKGATVFAASAAALSLEGCAPEAAGQNPEALAATGVPESWDKEVDVVVVGGGGTGLAAGVGASDVGAEVLVLEKTGSVGGSTALSGGCFQAAGTSLQKASGIDDDTPEMLAQCVISGGEGYVDEELIHTMTAGLPAVFDWFVEMGAQTEPAVVRNGHVPFLEEAGLERARGHEYLGGMLGDNRGKGWTDTLAARLEERGVEVMLNMPVTALYRDGEKGVVGVRAGEGSDAIDIKARKGVVLGTAGIDAGEDLAEKYCLWQYKILRNENSSITSCPGNTGDGIRMGLEIGAAWQGPGIPISGRNSMIGLGIYDGDGYPCIIVNRRGKRIACEDANYGYFESAAWQSEQTLGGAPYLIMDSKGAAEAAKAEEHPFAAGVPPMLEQGSKADSVEKLAEMLGIPQENLTSTVDEWNRNIEKTGADPVYGRNCGLVTIDEPPFYGVLLEQNASNGCLGGLKIDTSGRVLDTNGEAIPHLYAGGLNAGGWMGRVYPGSGMCLAGAFYWGKTSGENAAREASWE